jgi:hypothetical protein
MVKPRVAQRIGNGLGARSAVVATLMCGTVLNEVQSG